MKHISVFSFLYNAIFGYKKYYIIIMLAPIFTSFAPTISSYSIKLFIDQFKTAKNISYPIILFFSCEISVHIMWRISNILEWKIEPLIRKKILLNAYHYTQNLSYRFFQDNFTGNVSNKINGLLNGYDKIWREIYANMSIPILSTIISISGLFFVNIKIGIIMLLWALLFILINYLFSKKLIILSKNATESQYKLIGNITDNILNIGSLFLFALKDFSYNKIEKLIDTDLIPKKIQLSKYFFYMQIMLSLSCILMYSGIFYFSILALKNNKITIGDFVFIFSNVFFIVYRVFKVLSVFQDFSKTIGEFKSSLLLFEAENIVINLNQISIVSPSIEYKNISFGYESNKLVFDNFNLKIAPYQKVGIVGVTGAGKTTLINLLLKYFTVLNGSIIVDNNNIYDVSDDSLRQNIAVIPQDILLFHDNILENVRCGNILANDEDVFNACKKAEIHDDIIKMPLQYNTIVGERGIKLSGGQRQRIAIARAILKNAPILILDEATSALDSETEQKIQRSINNMLDQNNATVIAIAHRLSTIKHLERIIVVSEGKIIEDGSFNELIAKNGAFKGLWDAQVNGMIV